MKDGILAQLAALDLATDPYQEAKRLIYQLQKIGIIEYTLHAGKTMTRGRTNELAPNRLPSFSLPTDLSFKPQRYNKEYQRASTPRQTVFYGSLLPPRVEMNLSERMISVSEASILLRQAHLPDNSPVLQQEGITFGDWMVKEDISLLAVCYHEMLAQRTLLGQELYEALARGIAQLPAPLREQSLATNAFFAQEFGKPSHTFAGSYEYLISAVFTEVAVERGFAGVYYPSVKADGQGFNVAIAPDCATQALQLNRVLECTLYKRDGRFMLGNDKFCYVEPGADSFTLQPLAAPHYTSLAEATAWFDSKK